MRFAPDTRCSGAREEIAKATALYECVDALTESAALAFAKWEPPADAAFVAPSAAGTRSTRGAPCWWRTSAVVPASQLPLWLDTMGLSKGIAYINGRNPGRYFTATATGQRVGPQPRLYVPAVWLRSDAPNELLIFDEHGFNPQRTRLVFSETGELE